MNAVKGQHAAIKTMIANGNTITHAAINWSLEIDPKAKDISNFRDGRFRSKTLQDAKVTATVVHDADAAEYLTANGGLIDGQVLTVYCFQGNNTNTNYAYIVPAMITKLTPKNDGPEDVLMTEFEASLHNGSVTYPTV